MLPPMTRALLAVTAGLLAASALPAQEWAAAKLDQSPRHQEWIQLERGSRKLQCFVVYPEVSGRVPVVLVIHEIFGLTDWARDLADQVAAAGYIAVEPDLLSGMAPGGGGTSAMGGQSAAVRAVSLLPPDQVAGDLQAAADYALRIPAGNGKLVVAGFCWGGGQSFRFATERPDLKAAFVFYGPAPAEEAAARIKCPVYGFYGGADARISVGVPGASTMMAKLGKTYQPVIYDGAGHGFMRSGEAPGASAANQRAHDAAWERWKALMAGI